MKRQRRWVARYASARPGCDRVAFGVTGLPCDGSMHLNAKSATRRSRARGAPNARSRVAGVTQPKHRTLPVADVRYRHPVIAAAGALERRLESVAHGSTPSPAQMVGRRPPVAAGGQIAMVADIEADPCAAPRAPDRVGGWSTTCPSSLLSDVRPQWPRDSLCGRHCRRRHVADAPACR
jgi:hypothetical protein